LASFDGRTFHASTLLPNALICGTSMRVHFPIRADSFSGTETGGRRLTEAAFGERLGGPATTGERFLRKGAAGRRMRRSCVGIEKKP
jgi:hypothetical protein